MKRILTQISIIIATTIIAAASTPEQEKAFVESYKKALEAKDEKALAAFLYTKGAQAETIEFFKMMQSSSAGQKPSSIELVIPDAEQLKKLNKPMEMPDGKMYKLPFTPKWQLVITIEEKDGDSTSKSTSKVPVGEKDGKLVIPVPVPVE